MCVDDDVYECFAFRCFSDITLQPLTRAVYTTETVAMTGIEKTIGRPVAMTKINRLKKMFNKNKFSISSLYPSLLLTFDLSKNNYLLTGSFPYLDSCMFACCS